MIAQSGTLEISRQRVHHNLALLQRRADAPQVCPVLKANAYGHGISEIASILQNSRIQRIAVYSLDEALHPAASDFNILVLAPLVLAEKPGPQFLQQLLPARDNKVNFNITDIRTAQLLSHAVEECDPYNICIPIHVQIDAGLTRAGVAPSQAAELLGQLGQIPNLEIKGIFAHFSHGDVPGHPSLDQQLKTLTAIARPLKERHPNILIHAQNSGGIWHLGNAGLNMVRIGIALYGLQPSTQHPIPGLLPVARLTAPILAIHDRPAGVGVGYGHTFVTPRPSKLAVVPVGYADGYPRQLSGRGIVQLREHNVPVVGRVSMDQIILDVTDHPAASAIHPGEPVTLISNNPAHPNCLDAMADAIGTIGYELATHLGSRLRRVIVD